MLYVFGYKKQDSNICSAVCRRELVVLLHQKHYLLKRNTSPANWIIDELQKVIPWPFILMRRCSWLLDWMETSR
jgi:hypothetical protein